MREITVIPIAPIRFEDVVDFCGKQYREHMRLEYKLEFSAKSRGYKIAKEIAAFANTSGGTIMYGVEEKNRRGGKLGASYGIALSQGRHWGWSSRGAALWHKLEHEFSRCLRTRVVGT